MTWLKRNHLFGGVLLLCGLALIAEGWWWREARQQAGRALVGLEQKKQERDWLARQTPALSAANEQAIVHDLAQAAKVLVGLRAALQAGDGKTPATPPPPKPIDAYFDIAAMVEKTRALAARAQVMTKSDERFGFATHANAGPEAELLPAVYRQRHLAQFLVEALLEARPRALLRVQRERPLTAAQRAQRNQPGPTGVAAGAALIGSGGQAADFFDLDALSSLRLPGRIESESFRFEFTGQTPALRAFLNSLATGPLPVIVRRVEVERLTTETSSTAIPPAGAPVPLVSQNLSKFAVVVECVELLPAPEPSTP